MSDAEPKPTAVPPPEDAGDRCAPDDATLRLIFDRLPMMVFWKDAQRRHRGNNRAFRDAMGLAASSDTFGLTDADLLGDTDVVREYQACDQKVLSSGKPLLNIEETVVSSDGQKLTLLTSKVPLFSDTGEVSGLLAVACDISTQKQMQREAEALSVDAERRIRATRQQERLLRSVLEAIPQKVFWKDRDLRYVGSNEVFALAAGLADVDELVGLTDHDLCWGDQGAQNCSRCDEEVMSTGRPLLNVEETLNTQDGKECVMLISKVPIRNDRDEVIGLLGTLDDISERKAAEKEREHLQAQLIEVSRDAGKAEVATGVLHEVGNAVNSISVAVEQLGQHAESAPADMLRRLADTLLPRADDFEAYVREEPRAHQLPRLVATLADAIDADQRALCETIVRLTEQVEHVKAVVSSQQAFSRICSNPERVLAGDLAAESVRIAFAGRQRRGLRVEIKPEDPPLSLVVDRRLVVQALVNFLNNAAQAMPPVAHQGHIQVSTTRSLCGTMVCFAVEDNGRGIDAENLPRLFEHGFTTRRDGHGFGLHTTSLAVQSMGGRVEAQSDGPGHGSCFTLTVPVDPSGFEKRRAA